MTNHKRLMRQANALCKIIRQAREEAANPPQDHPFIRAAKAVFLQQPKAARAGLDQR